MEFLFILVGALFALGVIVDKWWSGRSEPAPEPITPPDPLGLEEDTLEYPPGLAPTVQPRPRPIPRDPIDEVHHAITADDDPDDDALARKRILDRERARLRAAATRREQLDHIRAGRRDREADD